LLGGIAPEVFVIERAAPDPAALCVLAAGRTTPARPLYLRAPDAKLPGGKELGGRDLQE
jgi:tRNA threonylcarbamoyladenosine biosynthesis protein TsaB